MASRGFDLLEQCKISTELRLECTVHTFFRSDPARQKRRTQATQEWTRVKPIGRGSFGVVYLEREKEGELRAVKKVFKSGRERDDNNGLRELLSLATISKDNVNFPTFHGWYDDIEHIFIAMEYFPFGDLREYRLHSKKAISDHEARLICFQLAEALEAIHYHSITHRDLKPNNVFVVREGPDWWVKLGDFGMAKRVRNEDTALHTILGGVYVAPEILGLVYIDDEVEKVYTSAVDIWSLGCVAYWVVVGVDLFSPKTLIQSCQRKSLPEEPLAKISTNDEYLGFVRSCLEMQPDMRPDIMKVLDLPWLRNRDTRLLEEDEQGEDLIVSGFNSLEVEELTGPVVGVKIYKANDPNKPAKDALTEKSTADKVIFLNKNRPPFECGKVLEVVGEHDSEHLSCKGSDGQIAVYQKKDLALVHFRNWRGVNGYIRLRGFLYEYRDSEITIGLINGIYVQIGTIELSVTDIRYITAWVSSRSLSKSAGLNPNVHALEKFLIRFDCIYNWFAGPGRMFSTSMSPRSAVFSSFKNGLVELDLHGIGGIVIPLEWISWQAMLEVQQAYEGLPELKLQKFVFPQNADDNADKFNTVFPQGQHSWVAAGTVIFGFNPTRVHTSDGDRALWRLSAAQRAHFQGCLKNMVQDLKTYQQSRRFPLSPRQGQGVEVESKYIVGVNQTLVFWLRKNIFSGLKSLPSSPQAVQTIEIRIAETEFLLRVQELDFAKLGRDQPFRQWDRRGVDDEIRQRLER